MKRFTVYTLIISAMFFCMNAQDVSSKDNSDSIYVIQPTSFDNISLTSLDQQQSKNNMLDYMRSDKQDGVMAGYASSKRHLKICVIGNSYSLDSFGYLPFILQNYGITIEVGMYYRGGASLRSQIDEWDSDTHRFFYINTREHKSWQTISYYKYSPKKAVQFTDWDIVVMQQGSQASVSEKDYNDDADTLVRLILGTVKKPVLLAWNININRASSGDDTKNIQNGILSKIKNTVNKQNIDMIFPYGTAIFNARTNPLLSSLSDGGNFWAKDQIHLQEGLPCYIAALANVQALFDRFYPQYSVLNDKTRPTQANIRKWDIKGQDGESVGINETNCRLAQMYAMMANRQNFKTFR